MCYHDKSRFNGMRAGATNTHMKITSLTAQQLHTLHESAARLSPVAARRLQCILSFFEHGMSMTDACRNFAISRGTLYRWIDRFDPDDVSSLEDQPASLVQGEEHAVTPGIIALIRAYRTESPMMGKEAIAERIVHGHQIPISASTVGRVIERECLYFGETPLHIRKRLAFRLGHTVMASQQIPGTTEVPSAVAASSEDHHSEAVRCACIFCKLHHCWPRIRRGIAIVSVVTNIAFFAALIASAWFESAAVSERQMKASLNSFDSPNK